MGRNQQSTLFAGLVLFFGMVLALNFGQPAARADVYKSVVRYFNVSAPGANTDAITDLVWDSTDPARITIQAETGTIVNVMVTRGATEKAFGMNAHSAVTAGGLYTWDVHGLEPDDVLNIQVETDSALSEVAIGKVLREGS